MPTISGDIATLQGSDHTNGDPVALYVECSQPILVDGATGRTGGRLRIPVSSDGTFSMTGLPASVGGVPLYRLQLDSRALRLQGLRAGITSGWFPLTVDRDLTWIVANYVEVTTISAATAVNVAAAAALGATNDTASASFVGNPGSATRAALEAWAEPFVREGELMHNVKDYGATGDGTTNDTVAVQAAIDAGGITYFPPGAYKCKGLVAPAFGLNLLGASTKGGGQSAIVGVGGDTTDILTTASGTIVHNWSITNLHIEAAPGGGHCMSGGWSLGVISGCSFVQPNNGKSAITVSAWIDCSIEGYTNFNHTLTATQPTFKALSAVGDVAQLSFENVRFLNSGDYSIWLEATSSQMIYNVRIVNANFEIPTGGAIKLLSCRNVVIENPGMWDMHTVGASRHLIHIGKSTGADSRFVTIRNYLRDASLPPVGGICDIFVQASAMKGLLLESCGHPLTDIIVDAGSTTGAVVNSPGVDLGNGFYMTTDEWQLLNPTVTGTGTAVGNGTVTGRQRRRGDKLEFQYRFVLGSTSTVGSGGVSFSLLPAPSDVNRHLGLTAVFTDTGTAVVDGRALLVGSTVKVYTSTYGNVTATAPFTWAVGDVIEVRGSYEIAP